MHERRIAGALTLALVLLAARPVVAGWEEGVAAYRAGRFSEAAREFAAVVEQRPDWADGHHILGMTYLKMKRGQEALAHLEKARELRPGHVPYQLSLGQAYVQVGRRREAAALLERVDSSQLPVRQREILGRLEAGALAGSEAATEAPPCFAEIVRGSGQFTQEIGDVGCRFSFEGKPSVLLRLAVESATPGLDPKVALYGPDGTRVALDDEGGAGADTLIAHHLVTQTGRYEVAVSPKAGSTGTLTVAVDFEKLVPLAARGCEGGALESGVAKSVRVWAGGCRFFFDGERGELVTLAADGVDGFDPVLSLRDPAGDEEAFDDDSGGGGASLIRAHRLLHDGRYLVFVRHADEDRPQDGEVRVLLQRGG